MDQHLQETVSRAVERVVRLYPELMLCDDIDNERCIEIVQELREQLCIDEICAAVERGSFGGQNTMEVYLNYAYELRHEQSWLEAPLD